MDKYVCTKGFSIDKYDDGGFLTGEFMDVEKGDVFIASDAANRIIGNKSTVHLDSDNGSWLEISKATLEEHFEGVEHDDRT